MRTRDEYLAEAEEHLRESAKAVDGTWATARAVDALVCLEFARIADDDANRCDHGNKVPCTHCLTQTVSDLAWSIQQSLDRR